MLGNSKHSSTFWTYDNWGANPSATIGTSVTPGASNNLGSWTQVASAANIAEDVYGFYLQVIGGATASATKPQLLSIGVDQAGGTSYSDIISDFQIGMSPAVTVSGVRQHYFPFFIKAGSSVAVRIRGANATAGTVRIAVRFYGRPSDSLLLRAAHYSETFGAVTASSLGTTVTPGNAADGGWEDLGALTNPLWWWQIGYCINNSTVTAEYTYLEVAYGDASNKQIIFKEMHSGTTGESCGLVAQTQLLSIAAYNEVAAGNNIYVRARCINAPDTGYNVTVVGLGGG